MQASQTSFLKAPSRPLYSAPDRGEHRQAARAGAQTNFTAAGNSIMNLWWSNQSSERYWLESTDREDIGSDLRAPELDQSGKENWRYSLFKHARPGDIVLHYDKRPEANGIVGWSVIAGSPAAAPIICGARGTYAREKRIKPHERAGFKVPLTGFTRLLATLTLDEIRRHEVGLRDVVASEERQHGKPLYFPFELSNKPPARLLQGYGFKVPKSFMKLFSTLSAVVAETESQIAEPEQRSKRNPPWTRDELILALELYMQNPASPPSQTSVEVQELSATLNKLGAALGLGEENKFRNANGVYMKMMNFRRFDPNYTASGKVGLTRGNKDEADVWREFAHDKDRLTHVANAIRQAVTLPSTEYTPDLEEGIVEAEEGRLLTRLHRRRERSSHSQTHLCVFGWNIIRRRPIDYFAVVEIQSAELGAAQPSCVCRMA